MKEHFRICAVQVDLAWENPSENRDRLHAFMESVPSSDLYVLPEMFTTGFTMNPAQYAESFPGETLDWMRNEARLRGAALVGSVTSSDPQGFTNKLIWVNPDGSYYTYNKAHLFSLAGEEKQYLPGDKKMIITYLGWKFLPLICYDLRFPEWSRNTMNTEGCDYDVLLYVANWPDRRVNAWDALLKARAIENQAYVCGVNRVGYDGNDVWHSGHSALYGPDGEQLAAAAPDTEEAFTHILNADALASQRRRYSFLSDQRYSISQLGLSSTGESK
jgi:omega-amidase